MAVLDNVTEGWTGRLVWTLKANGVAFDGTGLTVSDVILTGADNSLVDTDGDFGWVDATAGTVYYDADPTDFVAPNSPYRIHVEVTDGSGKVVYWPNGKGDEINVYPK